MDELLTITAYAATALLQPRHRHATALPTVLLQPNLKPAHCLERRSDDASDAGRQRRLKRVVKQKPKAFKKCGNDWPPTFSTHRLPGSNI